MATLLKTWNPPIFQPHPLVRGGKFQTLFPFFSKGVRAPAGTIRHTVTLEDGDAVVLHDDCPPIWKPGDPAILLMHGLGGCYLSSYLRRAARRMTERGWRTFRMDHRGSGAARNLAQRPYHAGRIHDPLMALHEIASLAPLSPLAAVGFSLSGNMVLKLAATGSGELPEQFRTLVAVCPAIDLQRTSENIRHPKNRGYDEWFAKILWRMAPQYGLVRGEFKDLLERKKKPLSVYRFDEEVTAPLGGFRDVEDYYSRSSSIDDLPKIRHAALVIGAEDDPLIPVESLREATYSDSTEVLIAPSGGHMGFIGRKGIDPDRRWMDWRIIEWIEHQLS